MPVLQRSPPTKCRLPVGGREGSRCLKLGLALPRCAAAASLAGPGRAGMVLGRVSECPWYTERHRVRAGVPGDSCALPQGAQAVCSGSSAALFTSPDNHRVSSGGPWHWMLLGSPHPLPSFFFFPPSQCDIPSGFSRELWNVSRSRWGPPEQDGH